MSYSININGHGEGEDFEREIAEKAKEFVASLEGVTYAMMNGAKLGMVKLNEE